MLIYLEIMDTKREKKVIFELDAETKVLADKSNIDHEKTCWRKKSGNKFVAISKNEEGKKFSNASIINSTINGRKSEENLNLLKSLNNYDNTFDKKNILTSTLLLTEPDILDQNEIQPQLNLTNSTRRILGAKSIILRN